MGSGFFDAVQEEVDVLLRVRSVLALLLILNNTPLSNGAILTLWSKLNLPPPTAVVVIHDLPFSDFVDV